MSLPAAPVGPAALRRHDAGPAAQPLGQLVQTAVLPDHEVLALGLLLAPLPPLRTHSCVAARQRQTRDVQCQDSALASLYISCVSTVPTAMPGGIFRVCLHATLLKP